MECTWVKQKGGNVDANVANWAWYRTSVKKKRGWNAMCRWNVVCLWYTKGRK